MSNILVSFTLHNHRTKSLIAGARNFRGESFGAITDQIKPRIDRYKSRFLKLCHSGEDPADWELLGFQEYAEYEKRFNMAEPQPVPSEVIKAVKK